ncbi:MAG: O-antigen ligase family protein [Lachnospiraceae bacterium]|nr:O-antigen ligase family protein [Lachnospiraceae bacterium]
MQRLLKYVLSKRTMYILCFVALNIIELLRSGPSGVVWYVANNCTGIAMMFLVLSGYKLKNFMTATNYVWTALCVAFMIFLPFHWRNHIGEYLLWQVETAVFNVWWIFIVAKYQLSCIFIEKSLKVNFNITSVVWIAMMSLMVLSVNEYRVWPLWFLFMFGIFYLTPYTSEDRELLWSSMIDGNIIGFFILQIYAYGLRPYDTLRYSGYASNCNVAALYYLVIYVMCLCKLHQLEMKKSKRGWKIFYLLGAGGMLSFQFLTMGRTAWIISIVVTLLYGLIVVKRLWNKSWKQVIVRGIIIVAFMVVTFLPVFYTCRWLPTLSPGRVWYEAEYHNDDLIHSGDPATSEKYTDLDEFLESVFGRIAYTLKMFQVKDPFAMTVYATDGYEKTELLEPEWLTDPGTRIRLSIYKAYLGNLKWFGHKQQEGMYQIGDLDYVSWHGHNLWIHIAYYYGIPVGILLIAITVLLFRDSYKKIENHKDKWYCIIPFFTCVAFFGYGIMEAVWYVGHILFFLIFFVQLPMNSEPSKKSKED